MFIWDKTRYRIQLMVEKFSQKTEPNYHQSDQYDVEPPQHNWTPDKAKVRQIIKNQLKDIELENE